MSQDFQQITKSLSANINSNLNNLYFNFSKLLAINFFQVQLTFTSTNWRKPVVLEECFNAIHKKRYNAVVWKVLWSIPGRNLFNAFLLFIFVVRQLQCSVWKLAEMFVMALFITILNNVPKQVLLKLEFQVSFLVLDSKLSNHFPQIPLVQLLLQQLFHNNFLLL